MALGCAISTHNRKEVFEHSYSQWLKYMPENSVLIVVDDASEEPVSVADYRFEEQAGIAKVKNKCIKLLEQKGVTDYFLADDDIFPTCADWFEPYLNSGLNHAMYTWDRLHNGAQIGNKIVKRAEQYIEYSNPCGCLLYFKPICFDLVGGMDKRYGLWGYEHVSLSRRIYNAGLTPAMFLDVNGAFDKFYSHDYKQSTERSLSAKVRSEHIKRNIHLFNSSTLSTEYIPYKPMNNTVITTYFTGYADPQRQKKWVANHDEILPLIESLQGEKLVIINDCFDLPDTDQIKYVRSECNENPYHFRWKAIRQYLKENEHDFVFCVDATDVKMLKNPFERMSGINLYTGDEVDTLKNKWLLTHHSTPFLAPNLKQYKDKTLLNAGLLGGKRSVVLSFLDGLVQILNDENAGYTDMGAFNYVAHAYFSEILMHGRIVNTVFKSFKPNNISWFQHK